MALGRSLAGLLAASALGASGCRSCEGARAEVDPAERPLTLGTVDEPDTLDPLFTEIAGAQEIVRLLFRDLTDYDERWTIHPSLAAALPEVETSSSGAQRVSWRLREGLAWSDGAPLTADDVVFGYEIAADPDLETTSRQMTGEIARVVARSPLEVVVEWKRPYPGYASPRVHPVLPRHAYPDPKKSGAPFRGFGRAPVSSGPYRLLEWVPGQHLTLEPNPFWRGTKPAIPRIVFRFFKSEDAFEAELRTGGIDALGEASGLSIERAQGMAARLAATHVVQDTDSGLWLHLEARADHFATGDPTVRRAISRAIDRDAMSALVYEGRATPAYGCFPPRHPAHTDDPAGGPADGRLDRAAAERMLDAAGFVRGPDGTRVKDGRPLALDLQFASGSQASERAAAFVQSELAKIGVAVRLEAMPLRVLFSKLRERSQAPLVLFAWRSSPDWDALAMLQSSGAQNYGDHRDPELDRLLEHAKNQVDPARWAEALRAVEARYRERLPSIPLLFRRAVSVRPRALLGWAPTGSTTPVTWNAESWRWSDAGPPKSNASLP